MQKIRRGDLFYADLNPVVGSEQGGLRPVVIIQNDKGNYYSPTTIVAALTSSGRKKFLPTHVEAKASHGLPKDSFVLTEQVRTVDKTRLKEKIGHFDRRMMEKINQALAVSLGCDRD